LRFSKQFRADERTKHFHRHSYLFKRGQRIDLGAYDYFANSYVLKPVDFDRFVTRLCSSAFIGLELNALRLAKSTWTMITRALARQDFIIAKVTALSFH